MKGGPDCTCAEGQVPWCASCAVSVAFSLWLEHGGNLTHDDIGTLRRRIPKINGYVAAILIECMKRLPPPRNGARYVERGSADSD